MILNDRVALLAKAARNAHELVNVHRNRYLVACEEAQACIRGPLRAMALARLDELTQEEVESQRQQLVMLATEVGQIGAKYAVKLFGHPTSGATTALLNQEIGTLLDTQGQLPSYSAYNHFLRRVFFSEYPFELLTGETSDARSSAAKLMMSVMSNSGEVE